MLPMVVEIPELPSVESEVLCPEATKSVLNAGAHATATAVAISHCDVNMFNIQLLSVSGRKLVIWTVMHQTTHIDPSANMQPTEILSMRDMLWSMWRRVKGRPQTMNV